MHALAASGDGSLSPVELMSLRELKLALNDPTVRREIREELAARLVIIVRRGFEHLKKNPTHYETGDGPIKYLGVYANLLLRTLDKWPSAVDEAIHVEELKRIDKVIAEAREEHNERPAS